MTDNGLALNAVCFTFIHIQSEYRFADLAGYYFLLDMRYYNKVSCSCSRGCHARSRAHAAALGYDGTVTLPDFSRIEENTLSFGHKRCI